MIEKVCLECRKPLFGRRDKKFCDDGCRNGYHNRLNSERPMSVRSVNTILSKNRKIMSQIVHIENNQKVSANRLLGLGFDFNYFTGRFIMNDKEYHQCYEFAYVNEDNETYTVFPKPIRKS